MINNKYKAVIFDFDYTLGSSEKGIVLSVNHGLLSLGYPEADENRIYNTIGLSLADTFKDLTGVYDPVQASKFAALFKEKADKVMVENTELYHDCLEVISNLRKEGCLVGIVTTKFHYRIDQILSKYNAADMVDVIVGGEDVKAEKPDPQGLIYAIKTLGVSDAETLYVGDSLTDSMTALNAGVDFAAVLTGKTLRKSFENKAHVCIADNLTGIYNFLFSKL